MPNLKRYSTTKATALALGVDSDDTEIIVTDGSTYPDPATGGNGPYTILVGYGSDREEICTVVAKSSPNSFTVLRAQDGSIATSKNIGDVVVHGVSKRDWNDMLDTSLGGTMAAPLVLAANPVVPLEAATKQYVDASAPIGMIAPFNRQTAPEGWHLCDGTAHGSAALEAVSGSPTTPDIRDRFIVAAGNSYAIGATGGAATVALTEAQMPTHTHVQNAHSHVQDAHNHTQNQHSHAQDPHDHSTVTDGAHFHNSIGHNYTTSLGYDPSYAVVPTINEFNFQLSQAVSTNNSGHDHDITTATATNQNTTATNQSTTASNQNTTAVNQNTGSGTAHENRPPYYALIYCVKKV